MLGVVKRQSRDDGWYDIPRFPRGPACSELRAGSSKLKVISHPETPKPLM